MTADLLDYDEAARRLRVSTRYLRKRVSEGALVPTRFGRRVLFTAAELDRFVASHTAVAVVAPAPVTRRRREQEKVIEFY